MKTRSIVLFLMIMASIKCFSQKSNELRVYYGFVDSELIPLVNMQCGVYSDISYSFEFGIKYLREISNRLSIQTGINFLSTRVPEISRYTGIPKGSKNMNVELISIPIYTNLSLGKHFFIFGGPLIDFHLKDKSFTTQSGIGYTLGIGGKFSFKNYKIYITPNYKRHSLIPFKKENFTDKLLQLGIQLGVGYVF